MINNTTIPKQYFMCMKKNMVLSLALLSIHNTKIINNKFEELNKRNPSRSRGGQRVTQWLLHLPHVVSPVSYPPPNLKVLVPEPGSYCKFQKPRRNSKIFQDPSKIFQSPWSNPRRLEKGQSLTQRCWRCVRTPKMFFWSIKIKIRRIGGDSVRIGVKQLH